MISGTRPVPMTAGELSRHTGVSIKNLRHHTGDGLIYTAGRSQAGYRLFDTEALWCVHLIGQLRGLGLTLAEIRELTRAYRHRTGDSFGPRLAARLQASRERLQARITETQHTLRRIETFETGHQGEPHDDTGDCWAGDPRCAVSA